MNPVRPEQRVTVLGVRHHGPGSARAVVARLDELRPDVVLLEGPADADALAQHVADPDLVPPVALLGCSVETPALSAFWPMAAFSPEWQTLLWAVKNEVPVRFFDLPAATLLGLQQQRTATEDDGGADQETEESAAEADARRARRAGRSDPIRVLAQAAGYEDPERWWEDVVEQTATPDLFEALTTAMKELRDSGQLGRPDLVEQQREAHMRQVVRTELKAGRERVAVVCGAWHAPAVSEPLPPAAGDIRLLRGLPKVKVSLTWIPWTHSRLSFASGYGAGVASPGWYEHLFLTRSDVTEDWLTRVAESLRGQDLPVSTAHVIEAVQLARALAVLRGRPMPGLAEVQDATVAVLCDGQPFLLDLVTRELVVGESLGEVPETLPTVPLERDISATTRRLRLKREPSPVVKELDLRKETDLARSRLLHRLNLLGVPWGTLMVNQTRNLGTFRETWQVDWPPELAVQVIDASVWGTTVESASVAKAISDALSANLSGLTGLVEACLLADLPEALGDLVAALDVRAAKDHDVVALMKALPALARSVRYGDVRESDAAGLTAVFDGLLLRVCAGLPAALGSLDDDAATGMRAAIDAVHAAVALQDEPDGTTRWLATLHAVMDRADLHGLLAGRITRLLTDAGSLSVHQVADRLARAVSVGSEPAAKAAWVEGFLAGSGLMLIHDATLLGILDRWVRELPLQDFDAVVPLLRRTFGQLAGGERQAIGHRVRGLGRPSSREAAPETTFDVERAAAALATVLRIQRGGGA